VDPFLLMEPKSEQIQRRSSTKEGLDFQRRNRGLFEEFPHTAYYAQPDDAMDEFDYTAYIESLRTGARVPKTPEQWQAAANHALGSFEYETAKRELTDPTSEQSKAYLKAKKAWLVEQYPGYDPGSQLREFGSVSQPSRKAVIRELEKWRGNEFLSGTNAGQGLTKYFQARDQAMRRAVELGLQPESFATAKRAEPIRDYLRATAAWIVRQPEMAEFGSMWTFVLQHELKDDGDE